jgi:hypothetical protein
MTLYDTETRVFIKNKHEIPARGSRMDLIENADGEVASSEVSGRGRPVFHSPDNAIRRRSFSRIASSLGAFDSIRIFYIKSGSSGNLIFRFRKFPPGTPVSR